MNSCMENATTFIQLLTSHRFASIFEGKEQKLCMHAAKLEQNGYHIEILKQVLRGDKYKTQYLLSGSCSVGLQ